MQCANMHLRCLKLFCSFVSLFSLRTEKKPWVGRGTLNSLFLCFLKFLRIFAVVKWSFIDIFPQGKAYKIVPIVTFQYQNFKT